MSDKPTIRLHHPVYKAPPGGLLNYAVELAFWPMPAGARPCFACSVPPNGQDPGREVIHAYKTLHLRLDSAGDVFVAPGILELLNKVPTRAGLEISNEVNNAPGQKVGAVEQPTVLTINASQNGPGHSNFYVPGRTQQEAEKVVQAPFKAMLEPIAEKHDRQVTAAKAEKRTIYVMGRRKEV